jgi:Ca2+-binding RTX toxin-like protein
VQVFDGIFTVTAETTITVTNLDPQITSLVSAASTVGHASEGSTVVVEGSFLDPGVLDTHTATIDWGDGTTSDMTVVQAAGSGTLQASHAYVYGGSYEVLVTVTDDDGGGHQQTLTLFVTGARLQDGVLQIVGTSTDDVVSVNRQGDGTLMLHASFLPDTGGLRLFGPADPIDVIVVWLGDGNDTFSLAGNIDIPLIALGQAGDDQIQGGQGRDLLIGGTGADQLMGHMNEDILIGGSTAYDTNLAALLAILREWNAERSFSERMQNLTDGTGTSERLNGNVFLVPGSTVFDDEEVDELDGGANSDWVFVGVGDYGP